MSQIMARAILPVVEAWGMVERAEAGDSLSVGVALDYVMDGCGCSREDAKLYLYRHCCRKTTVLAAQLQDRNLETSATNLVNFLWDGIVQNAKLYMRGYGTGDDWGKKVKRWVKLCSWIESVE